ncbi:hypothetical protein BJY01DRAFT_231118 [Aspergillus pseudoustus]|uniref:D-xylose 1-dehydrogenase (NADP(+), D-xylono-1,5-lactone-forming) n=1 Tax=Aspergillus pseudoustus TaxID=1810923 RepID=A0ABR4KXQ9_9EURO
MAATPSVRWGILGTGFISSWFVEDLVLERPNAKVKHIIQSIATSGFEKGQRFAAQFCPQQSPTIYRDYQKLFNDLDVDIVYIGVPHAFHKRYCLAAIDAGKAVLNEKPFTLNAKEAREIFEAASKKGVYVAEAMWLRHRPLVLKLRELIHQEQIIGDPFRTFSDFGLDIDIASLPPSSRYRDPGLGAGSLLDVGIYSLTWAILTLDPHSPSGSEIPRVLASQSFSEGVEVTSSTVLHYASTGRQGIATSTTNINRGPNVIARVDGSDGYIEIEGLGGSMPLSFSLYKKPATESEKNYIMVEKYDFSSDPGKGFIHEADNTALDFLAGAKESSIMPWAETTRVMELMDEIRRQGGTHYPVD